MKIQRLHFTQYLRTMSRRAWGLAECEKADALLAAHEPFEKRETFVCVSGTKNGIRNAGQENKKSNQKVAELSTMQILIKATSNED